MVSKKTLVIGALLAGGIYFLIKKKKQESTPAISIAPKIADVKPTASQDLISTQTPSGLPQGAVATTTNANATTSVTYRDGSKTTVFSIGDLVLMGLTKFKIVEFIRLGSGTSIVVSATVEDIVTHKKYPAELYMMTKV